MSRKTKDIDERSRRTRDALARALIELSSDREIDAITVGQLARAAGIGRSTFYAHFTSLADFLRSSYASMLERSVVAAQQQDPSKILPTRRVFEHMARSSGYGVKVRQSREWPGMLAAGRLRLTRLVEANLAGAGYALEPEMRRSAAACIAGGLIGLIEQWTEGGRKTAPEQVEIAFERFLDGIVSSFPRRREQAHASLSTASANR